MDLKSKIREIPDWPKKGISFKDITPIIEDPKSFRLVIDLFLKKLKNKKIDKIVGIDARGFLLAAPIAYKLNVGIAIIRKKGKLPFKTVKANYSLEYGEDTLEMHQDSIKKSENVVIVDDVLATGGTAKATSQIIKKLGGKIVGVFFLIELKDLGGRKKLKGYKVDSFIKY